MGHCRRRGQADGAVAGRTRQRLVQRVENELVHRARVAEAYFGFGGMHIDVDQLRVDVEKQHKRRVTVVMQYVGIGLADGMSDHLVAHAATVDEKILGIARTAGMCGRTHGAADGNLAAGFVDFQRAAAEIVAEYRGDARSQRLWFDLQPHAAVVNQ